MITFSDDAIYTITKEGEMIKIECLRTGIVVMTNGKHVMIKVRLICCVGQWLLVKFMNIQTPETSNCRLVAAEMAGYFLGQFCRASSL